MITLTSASLNLLAKLIADSGNWSNRPMLDLSPAEKGNFTHLKKAGLVRSSRDEGIDWCSFTFMKGQIVTDGARTMRLEDCSSWSTITEVPAV